VIQCDFTFLSLCFTPAPADSGFAIFGFAEFLTALALLALVFNSSDFLYQFRLSVAPLPLKRITFLATATIGAGTLLTDLWFSQRWYAPAWGVSRGVLQGILGALFLGTALLWIWFGFMRPAVFGRWNYKHWYHALYRAVVRGSDTQLAVLAGELAPSAGPLIRLSKPRPREGDATPQKPGVEEYAHDTLLLLGNRKLCRHIVHSSPVTAIVFMEEAARQKRYNVPLGSFARNITTEALLNRDSILYHEDTYGADVLGWVQPFSTALYGDYRLVEGVAGSMDSPLDLPWRVAWEMDGEQFEAYCRITLITFKSYIETGLYQGHSYSMYRAIDVIKHAGKDLYTLDNQPIGVSEREPAKRVRAAVRFITEVIDFLGEQEDLRFGDLRHERRSNIFDDIADAMYEMIMDAAAVRAPLDTAWSIQHNAVWGRIFGLRTSTAAWRVLSFKLRRRLFNDIKELETLPNYRGSRALSICLNTMGLTIHPRNIRDRGQHALHRAILHWTKRNYMTLAAVHPPVAEHCLAGGISFEPVRQRLVKTYTQGLSLEPSRHYLELDPPREASEDAMT
jgi:hypothetical protein